jgi:hypothetical protein
MCLLSDEKRVASIIRQRDLTQKPGLYGFDEYWGRFAAIIAQHLALLVIAIGIQTCGRRPRPHPWSRAFPVDMVYLGTCFMPAVKGSFAAGVPAIFCATSPMRAAIRFTSSSVVEGAMG